MPRLLGRAVVISWHDVLVAHRPCAVVVQDSQVRRPYARRREIPSLGAPDVMRVLLVEDDAMIGKAVQQGLRNAGFSVDWVMTGPDAELALANDVYRAAILDLGLPGKDGLQILTGIRKQARALAVLIVTARDAVPDRITGLNLGADDYLVKPFDLHELIARLHASLRRLSGQGQPALSSGPLRLDPITREVSLHGAPVALSRREFALLETLLRSAGTVVTRAALEEAIYGWGEEIESNAIEVHLHNLRKKLGAETIKNVRGVGYRVASP